MFKSIALAGAIFMAATGMALAQSDCSEPIPPAAPPSKPNLNQISDASHDANQFMKQSDDYQECLKRDLRQKQAKAAKDKKEIDPSIADSIQAQIGIPDGFDEFLQIQSDRRSCLQEDSRPIDLAQRRKRARIALFFRHG
jgi:hypothetical protein